MSWENGKGVIFRLHPVESTAYVYVGTAAQHFHY